MIKNNLIAKIKLFNFVKKLLLFLAVSIFFTISCATPIQQIKSNPLEYKDKKTSVKGEVQRSITSAYMNQGIYLLKDKSGSEIWVLITGTCPPRGTKAKAYGWLRKNVQFEGINFELVLDARSKK